MELGVGTILEGKVTGITKFGAFVALPEGKTGMVHISEIAHSYVSDIREHLTEGQEVKVKVISIDGEGRVNLSIKKTTEPPPRQQTARPRQDRPAFNSGRPQQSTRSFESKRPAAPKEPATFEDKLKQFMADSDSKMSDLKLFSEKRGNRRRK